jgi:hypothetical protein
LLIIAWRMLILLPVFGLKQSPAASGNSKLALGL